MSLGFLLYVWLTGRMDAWRMRWDRFKAHRVAVKQLRAKAFRRTW